MGKTSPLSLMHLHKRVASEAAHVWTVTSASICVFTPGKDLAGESQGTLLCDCWLLVLAWVH